MEFVVLLFVWWKGVVYTCTAPTTAELNVTEMVSCISVVKAREALELGPEGEVVL